MSALREESGPEASRAPAALWPAEAPRARPGLSQGRGRGLFAVSALAPGDVVERACTVPIGADQAPVLDRMHPLGDFYFAHPLDAKAGLMVLGHASLINHSDAPNADVRFVETALGYVCELVALAPIAPGEEITYRYRCPLWFETAA
ncbi:MAG: SET domain-containing protein-lysine N-methyltransferase [Alphaproteobacteria bacterium]|nr:SET domain-containing protein-lysine N-methyltransferase [Alphaproteobacteria bacterium]